LPLLFLQEDDTDEMLLTHRLIVCAIERDRRVDAIGVRAFHNDDLIKERLNSVKESWSPRCVAQQNTKACAKAFRVGCRRFGSVAIEAWSSDEALNIRSFSSEDSHPADLA
jgi:hypothetical protein